MLKKCTPILLFLFVIFSLFIPVVPVCSADEIVFENDLTVGKFDMHFSRHTFKMDDPGEGTILINKNTPTKNINGGYLFFNKQLISLRTFLGGSDSVFKKDIPVQAINRLAVFLWGTPQASIHIEVSIKTILQPPEVTFTALPKSIALGDSSTLAWSTKNADSCTIEPDIGSVDVDGSFKVPPTETTTYTLTATGLGGSLSADETVTVTYPPPEVSIGADKETIEIGQSITLSWISKYAASCAIAPGIGNVERNGALLVLPTETATYTITAASPGGKATDSVTVTVNDPNAPPTVNFSVTPPEIEQGGSSTLSWTSHNGSVAHIDNGIGAVGPNGSIPVSPEHTTSYTLTVTGPTGSTNARAVVTVLGNQLPQPEGSFGEQYADLMPVDATVVEYDYRRFSLITGPVQDPIELPIANVSITIHDHPEYGTATTNAEGRFSIPVEGGGSLTVVYQKEGLITTHRKVYVPWNDIAIAETVQMITEDPVSTTMTFNGDPDIVVTAKSTDVTDASGTRAVTMVFSGDNQAYLVDENGNDVQQLTTITTRATEYTTPESMPARLPPTSAFTYCAEFRVDGAERVRFEKPVTMWVDNFLGFPVGEIVPVGYYDRDKGNWIPSENGLVVRLLDTDSDGVVDALDGDGDNQPDDFDGDQSFSDEVQGLEDKQRYAPASTFWRFSVTHFTPFDCNWPFGPPADAIASNSGRMPTNDQKKQQGQDSPICLSSYVEEKSRIFHEDIPIPGSEFTLHYDSSRAAGYKPGAITIPVSGDTVPDSLVRIIVKIKIAGKTYEKELPAAPKQTSNFEWDGLDHLGKPVTGPVAAHIQIGWVYYGVYFIPSRIGRAFGQPGNTSLTVPTRREITLWKETTLPIIRGKGILAEGWTLSAHHQVYQLDPSILVKGDGTFNRNSISIIETYAGSGDGGYWGDGGPAIIAKISKSYGLDIDAIGNLLIADTNNSAIRKVDTDGIITTFTGGNTTDIAVDDAGNVYFPNANNLWVIYANGQPERLAGDYHGNYSGDGGPAKNAQLSGPLAVDVDSGGNIYIADTLNRRIRKIDTAGIITTVAGNGSGGYNGDGGPATLAPLNHPSDVLVDASGYIYIADGMRVRMVNPSGIITTVAGGSGSEQDIGDGGPATEAYLSGVSALAMDDKGNLYIAEDARHRVRMVNANGIISTIAGHNSGESGYSGDGGPPTGALLNSPRGLAVDANGNVYISDSDNRRIRKLKPPTPVLKGLMDDTDFAFTEESGVAFILSSSGRHKKTVDLRTGSSLYEFSYDEKNNLVSISDRFGNETRIERGFDGVPTAIISPDGIRTEVSIDANNHLKRISYPGDRLYDFEYTADGLLTSKTAPEKNRFFHAYDENGRLADSEDEEGGHWYFSRTTDDNGQVRYDIFTEEGNKTSHLDYTDSTGAYESITTAPHGAKSTASHSSDGLNAFSYLPCGTQIDFVYDVDSEYKFRYLKEMIEKSPGGLARITVKEKSYQDTDSNDVPDLITDTVTVNNRTTTLAHNTLQTQKVVTSPEGRTATTLYNPNTLLTESVSAPGLFDTSYGYDTQGRLTSITTSTRQTEATYNVQGFLETITDPENQTTAYSYDLVGRVTGIGRPDGGSVGFTYDKNGNMTVLTNPVEVGHGFGFNKVNRNSSYTTPLSGSYSYIYDRDRRLIQTNLPSGKSIINSYADPEDPDDKSRLWQIRTPEGNIDLTYLCGTKIDSITKGSESITYGYDGKLVTSEALAGTLNQSLTYTYNNDFDVSGFTYAGTPVTYSYDNDGLLTGAGALTITRNAATGLPETVAGGALNIARTFNGFGEVESQNLTVNSQNVAFWSLIRDNNGRITDKTETVVAATSGHVYTYDTMGRLLTVTKDSTLVEEYRYDLNGTRTYEMNSLRGIAGRNFTYSDEDHLLSAGSVTYAYDLDGFLTTETDGSDVTNYSYSARGELLSVTLPDGRLVEYIHDPLGRRIAKKINGAIVEKYLWQGLTRLLAVFDSADDLLMRFEYADDRMPMAMTAEGVIYYLTYDQIGSLRVVADGSGNVVKRIDYDSFGNIINDTNPSFEVPFGFAGGLHDRDTGLARFGYRDFDPDIGRWTAKDPILFAGGDTDLYGYVLKDPINSFDPEGLWVVQAIGGAIGAAGGAVGGFTSGLISGSGSLTAAILGGAAGGVAGFTVGLINPASGTVVGEMVGGIVGGAIGGAIGGAVSSSYDNEFSWKTVGTGAALGASAAAIASPGAGLVAYGTAGNPVAIGLMSASGGILGDAVISTGIAITNQNPCEK